MLLDAFAWGSRTLVVGILNLSPDSFSCDGLSDVARAVARAQHLVAAGADIIDVGGESTRPEFEPVSAEVELRRVAPVLEQLACLLPETPISIDTTKPDVARAAFRLGVQMLNDVNGLREATLHGPTPHGPTGCRPTECEGAALAALAAEAGVWVVAMHNQRGRPTASDPVAAVRDGWLQSLDVARRAGIDEDRILLDPGFGFGWRLAENAELLRRLRELRDLGRPILVGMSRKRMTGAQFGWGVDQRLEGSAAVTALSIANGADLVRVHDVAEMSRVARMTDAIVRP